MCIRLSIRLSICVPVRLLVCLPVSLPVCLPVCLSISLPVRLSVSPPVSQSVCLRVPLTSSASESHVSLKVNDNNDLKEENISSPPLHKVTNLCRLLPLLFLLLLFFFLMLLLLATFLLLLPMFRVLCAFFVLLFFLFFLFLHSWLLRVVCCLSSCYTCSSFYLLFAPLPPPTSDSSAGRVGRVPFQVSGWLAEQCDFPVMIQREGESSPGWRQQAIEKIGNLMLAPSSRLLSLPSPSLRPPPTLPFSPLACLSILS